VKITTPLGDYDYRVERVAVRDGRLEVAGRLGEWETTTVIDRYDLLRLARRIAPGIAIVGVIWAATARRRRV
jgi:hypothetical protein